MKSFLNTVAKNMMSVLKNKSSIKKSGKNNVSKKSTTKASSFLK